MEDGRGHKLITFFESKKTGLKGIIAVHDLTLGPALGGTRMLPYKTVEEAQQDVLRLSRGMTFKSAAAGVNLGGGKAVIIGDPTKDKSEDLFRTYAEAINGLGGQYITAEDIGISVADMAELRKYTKWVVGLPEDQGGSGDPSPVTALGIFFGMQAALEETFGTASFENRTVAVQGLGKVGYALCKLLSEAGASLRVSDTKPAAMQKARQDFGAWMIPPEQIHALDVDIFAPCARGAVITSKNVSEVKARIVAGSANNQLESDAEQGPALARQNVLYVPDFIINAGGIINVYEELQPGGYNPVRAMEDVRKIHNRVKMILKMSGKEKIPTTEAAMRLVKARLETE